ncbi:hypothetical protein AVEN_193903-1 [Araneus ventricosus]|uniref:Uncharacterized protein n=1 Tax=Araneus ventricosus TaxID=182803 RepID=A0A4Y2UVB7_ARAVE|nr:hypothetical protein AVEN_193903-1 [Araneus ventricosus]
MQTSSLSRIASSYFCDYCWKSNWIGCVLPKQQQKNCTLMLRMIDTNFNCCDQEGYLFIPGIRNFTDHVKSGS